MKYIFIVILGLLPFGLASGAENVTLIESENATNETTEGINQLLLNQFRENALNAEEKRQALYEELLKKYPDVVPPQREPLQSSGLSSLVYDLNFANTVFFSPGSSFITDVQAEKLDGIVDALLEEPTFNVILVGHSSFNTQIENSDQRFYYNSWISGRRAVQVWNYLTQKGIDETRIAAFARDSQDPLNGEDTVAETHMNRRVELRLTNQPVPIGSGNRVARPTGSGRTQQQQSVNNNVQQQQN